MSPIQNQILTKIRMSGCLSEAELEAYQEFCNNWEARLKIDMLDYRWTEEVPNHIIVVKNNGFRTYHLPKAGDWKFTAGMGILGILVGLFGMPLLGGPESMTLGMFMAGISALVLWKSSTREKHGWQNYDEARRSYCRERQEVLQMLPEALHPANRTCLHCVNPIT